MRLRLHPAALVLIGLATVVRSGDAQVDYRAVTFDFNRTGTAPLHWIIELSADGSGIFTGPAVAGVAPSGVPLHIHSALQDKLAAVVPVVQSGACETKHKNIAKTGNKTLTFAGAQGGAPVVCTFNFSDSEPLNAVSDSFLALAETMQAGDRLAQKHRYDRLGLDAELDTLIAAVKDGRAIEVANIAPVLKSIADDERVMERVQRKAARLLQDADVSAADNVR